MIPLALHGTGFKMGPKLCFSNISFGGINQKKKRKMLLACKITEELCVMLNPGNKIILWPHLVR